MEKNVKQHEAPWKLYPAGNPLWFLGLVPSTKVLKKHHPQKKTTAGTPKHGGEKWCCVSFHINAVPFSGLPPLAPRISINLNLHLHLNRNSQTCLKPKLLTSLCTSLCLPSEISLNFTTKKKTFFPANGNSSKIWTNNSPKTGHWQLLVEVRWTTHLPSGTMIRCNPPPFQRDFRESFQPTCGRHRPTPDRGWRLREGKSRKMKWVNLWIFLFEGSNFWRLKI